MALWTSSQLKTLTMLNCLYTTNQPLLEWNGFHWAKYSGVFQTQTTVPYYLFTNCYIWNNIVNIKKSVKDGPQSLKKNHNSGEPNTSLLIAELLYYDDMLHDTEEYGVSIWYSDTRK